MPNVPKFLIIHESDSDFGDVATIRRWHMAPPRCWRDIAYQKVILCGKRASKDPYDAALDGLIEQGRADKEIGAHCIGYNSKSIGICVVGVLDDHAMSQRQWESLCDACIRLCRRYSIPAENILGHRETASGKAEGKSCPGKFTVMSVLRALVKAQLAKP